MDHNLINLMAYPQSEAFMYEIYEKQVGNW